MSPVCRAPVVPYMHAHWLMSSRMRQISDVTNQLFPSVPPERLTTFSCGHIVPTNSLQTLVVKKGPKGSQMQFKYDSRSDQGLVRIFTHTMEVEGLIGVQMADLGQVLFNFANRVPGGMVVFVPSYAFLHSVMGSWEKSGLLERLRSKKKVRRYPCSIETHADMRRSSPSRKKAPMSRLCCANMPRRSSR